MLGPVKERKWESSGSAQPHSRRPSALKRPVAAETDGQWARPPSAVRPPSTRPDSRRSRPGSRIDLRPDSRLDSRHQEIMRPKSGVRPLSGKVYMRRTNDHGWVAKAYNVSEQMKVESQTEVNLFDDLSDGSLDSFFDDDFDLQTSEEKLGPLLSCNTLGVEAKGNRPDWVSGKLGLPEFHCPRCRDHWYGITDVPCDEELARLIREGLWRTGREEGGGGGAKHSRRRELSKGDKDRDNRSYSTDSLTSKSSKTRLNRRNENGDNKGHHGSIAYEEKERKKPKKHITFKLDNEFESSGSNNGSNTQLEGGGARRGRNAKGYASKFPSSDGRQFEISSGVSEQTNSVNSVKYSSDDGPDFFDGNKTDQKDFMSNKQRKAGVHNASEQLDSDNSGLLEDTERKKNKVDKNSKESVGGLMQFNRQADNESGENGQKIHGLQAGKTTYGTDISVGNTQSPNLGYSGRNLKENAAFSNKGPDDYSNTNGAESISTENLNNSKNDSHKRGGQKVNKTDSTLSSSSQVRSTGSRRGSLSMEDHGKNVRKPGGYMRAVSPSASDWGDPAHARSFISSTATSRSISRAGSLVNLGQDKDEEEERLSLPPIIPAINSKKPLLDLSDIMGGFQFTRAWTFSYHK